jgi:hypothetical protein
MDGLVSATALFRAIDLGHVTAGSTSGIYRPIRCGVMEPGDDGAAAGSGAGALATAGTTLGGDHRRMCSGSVTHDKVSFDAGWAAAW